MNHLLLNWKKIKLTIFCKICVIKLLALPKLTHLFFTLHNPPKSIIKKLNTLFFKLLWNGPDKDRRKVIIKPYEDGGIRMIGIRMV